MQEFRNTSVRDAYEALPEPKQAHLLKLRELVLDVADSLPLPGGVEETLKWGEPSYLPIKPKLGSTVRIGSFDETHVALYFNCQTMLVENFRTLFGDKLKYSKNRAVLFDIGIPLPEQEIRMCTAMALRYHIDKGVKA